jgi:hypothetical protein
MLFLLAITLSACSTTPPRFRGNLPLTIDGYKKAIDDQLLGPIWYGLCRESGSSASVGTVKLTFVIPAAGGQPREIKMAPTTANTVDQAIAIAAVRQLRAPAVPEAILRSAHKDHLDFDESFTIYQEGSPSPSPKR